MRPWLTLDTTETPDGSMLSLAQRGEEFVIRASGQVLMSSRQHGSEEALAQVACKALRGRPQPSLLIGGLGMGFTLRAALDLLPAHARVTVAELVPAIVQWNQGPLSKLANNPLEDPRVEVAIADVRQVINQHPQSFDAIALDVDNGPQALTTPANQPLYFERGLQSVRRALRPGGMLTVWSAAEDPAFVQRLRKAGFRVSLERPTIRGGKRGGRHVLFVAQV